MRGEPNRVEKRTDVRLTEMPETELSQRQKIPTGVHYPSPQKSSLESPGIRFIYAGGWERAMGRREPKV